MNVILSAMKLFLPAAAAVVTFISSDGAFAGVWNYSCSEDRLTRKSTCLVIYEGSDSHSVAFVGAMQMGVASLNIDYPEGIRYRTPSGHVETAACDQVQGQSCHIHNILAIGGLVDAFAVSETNNGEDVLIRVYGIGGNTDDMEVPSQGFVDAMGNNNQLAFAALQYRKFVEERGKIVDDQMRLLQSGE